MPLPITMSRLRATDREAMVFGRIKPRLLARDCGSGHPVLLGVGKKRSCPVGPADRLEVGSNARRGDQAATAGSKSGAKPDAKVGIAVSVVNNTPGTGGSSGVGGDNSDGGVMLDPRQELAQGTGNRCALRLRARRRTFGRTRLSVIP